MIDVAGLLPERRLDCVVSADDAGQRLDVALATLLDGFSRSQLQRLIKEGRVAIDQRLVTRASECVEAGQHITLTVPAPVPSSPRPESLPLDVLYEDSDLIVIDKPAGMVVHPAAGHAQGTLVNALLHHARGLSGIGGELRPGIVHRLDKGTSGVMVVAKHDRAHQELARQFSTRQVEKTYVALVWGVVHAGKRIDVPIGRDPKNRQRMSVKAHRARSATTHVTHAEQLRGVTLIKVSIATGRTHQIRVHLQSIGHPVVGDALYGGVHRRVPAHLLPVNGLERPFLHAHRLAFAHPGDGRALAFESPLPADLQRIIDRLRAAVSR